MTDNSTIQTRIDEIDALLAAGIKSASIGDIRTDYDLDALRRERARLQSLITNTGRSTFRRVVFKNG